MRTDHYIYVFDEKTIYKMMTERSKHTYIYQRHVPLRPSKQATFYLYDKTNEHFVGYFFCEIKYDGSLHSWKVQVLAKFAFDPMIKRKLDPEELRKQGKYGRAIDEMQKKRDDLFMEIQHTPINCSDHKNQNLLNFLKNYEEFKITLVKVV